MTYVEAAAAPLRKTGQIKLHGKDAFEGMRKAGRLVAECLDMLVEHVKPGVTTEALDKLVLEFGFDHGALPATLMYRGYKKASCTSINHVVCHGIPGDKPMKEGDIVNIDVTLILNGWHGDSSRMYAVGEIPRRAERLIDVTYDAMMRGIAVIRPGATTGDIGNAIQTFVEAQHMSVVRDFCGHGLGKLFHDEPNIVHVGRPGEGIVLRPGMFFTVEPMINLGRPHVKVLSDGWTAVTRDRSLSAQFEHTIGVTATGCRDLHDLAQRPRQAALPDLNAFCHGAIANAPGTPHPCRASAACSVRMPRTLKHETRKSEENGGPTEGPPHYLGHRERLRDRFLDGGPDAVTEYELLELVLFRAIPRRDVKPLAKALIAKFGSFAEVVSAPRPRLREIEGLGEAAIAEIKIVQAAASRLARGEVEEADGAVVLVGGARLLPHHDGLRRQGAVPRAVPRQAQPGDRRRGAANRHRGPHAGLSARSDQARAGIVRDRDHPGAQPSQSGDPTPIAAPTSR